MYPVLMVIHVIISITLILIILAQSSKGSGLDGMLGGAASNVLGGQSASSFLKNATKILAFLFMISCVLLAFQLQGGKKTGPSKLLDQLKEEAVEQTTTEQSEVPVFPTTEEPETTNE
ncbi:MAG: preprotein translocase subunit SecG [Armatimonadetes bacterium]|nr:preprotein translocase subunit SecG [Armatimonadota bacterium]